MRTLKLTIAYDGTRYGGWQLQNRRKWNVESGKWRGDKPTIQGALEHVLQQILQEPVRVIGSGRTDAGVHALAQVAHLKTRSTMPTMRLLRSSNALLPDDIAILRIEEAPAAFHARFAARAKQYRYRMATGAVVSPFLRPFVHHVRARLNVPLMRREAAALRGRHDVKAFARSGQPRRTTVRTIHHIRVMRCGSELRLDVSGDGFLHAMVRSIAGTLIDVGRGRLPPGTIRRMVRTGDRRLAGTTAPAKGLTLLRVIY